jgi:exosortase A-associated hydrolase 2
VRPAFIDGPAGPLFTLYHPPADGVPDRGDLIFLAPFAEELNRSRHMIARTARRLAANGTGVLLLDLYGTGDSAGSFGEGRLALWQDDVRAARHWLEQEGRNKIGLWAMRSGALLLPGLLDDGSWTKLLLWQPVIAGKSFLSQFLRVGVAAGLTTGETGPSPRDRLKAGETVEIAGYDLTPELAADLETAVLTPPPGHLSLHWLEIAASAPQPGPMQAKAAAEWRAGGHDVVQKALKGPQFWTLQEPEWAPEMIEASLLVGVP